MLAATLVKVKELLKVHYKTILKKKKKKKDHKHPCLYDCFQEHTSGKIHTELKLIDPRHGRLRNRLSASRLPIRKERENPAIAQKNY